MASPLGKVWDVGVGRDDDGRAFLGRGWPEFAAAHGLGVGWFVVLRHEGGGVLAVKVFDTTCCLKEFGAPRPAEESSTITLITTTSKGSSRSWEVVGRLYKNAYYLLGAGLKRFCHDNGLKVGDVCTFSVVETTLWRVIIERC
ncbi:hypothetical protein E2562_027303 [Oryza meyeriana var. granulata]|uniref:TF-B3 domain-containing protein n=1 Tax=Oryza meyeriana var. granulata TaxID=110450 RepID=A0A6G1C0U6_9ORYZ|nr:hypothetical protein E2562_027303 [Oryza meyeriana var. granulata]